MMLGLLVLVTLVAAAPTKLASERDAISALFKRQDRTYPPADAVPDRSTLPQVWLDKLASASIPDIPVAQGTGTPTYPGREITDPAICSFTYECAHPDDLQTPPAGTLAITFDDGPAGGSDALWKYLDTQGDKGKVTHFMIGSYITRNQELFRTIAQGGGHIAVHTWSHQYTTTLTNEQVVGELGWSMQIMADLNEGRIPMYWRPPFGDVDNRVRAIAKQVFGLETVIWSHDSKDWNLDQGRDTTVASIADVYRGWLTDRSQGLNVLHHEVRESQVDAFKGVHPALTEGWEVKNIADAWGLPWYQNAATGNSTIDTMEVGGDALVVSASSQSTSTASTASSASTTAQSAQSSADPSSTRFSISSVAPVASDGAARPSGAAGQIQIPQAGVLLTALYGAVMMMTM